MINRKDRKFSNTALLGKQRGGALILIAFMIGIMLTAFLIKNFSANSIKAEQDAKTMEALGNAKDGLISWAVSHSTAPGQMPWPDRRELTSPNYDGQSDCSNANFNLLNSASEPNFLGQIPTIASTTPCQVYPGVGNRFLDSSGNNLWYAVSRNLVRRYSPPAADPVINPGIINSPTYPWMIVRNSAGDIISDRVAVVIIAPGPALPGQDRSGAAPLPVNFLDQVTIGANTYSNFDYAVDAEDFIIGDITSGTFNDHLVYITVDELMYALENRVANEISNALLAYQSANLGNLPNAAPLGSIDNYVCQAPLSGGPHLADPANAGLLPITSKVAGSDFNCAIDRSGMITTITCDNHFTNKASISFSVMPAGIPFNAASGLCTLSDGDRTCTCTGEGECGTPGPFFLCDDVECRTNVSGGTIKINSSAGYEFTEASGSCSLSCNSFDAELTCITTPAVYAGSGSRDTCDSPALTTLPTWITTNRWQDYFYYRTAQNEISRLSSGGRVDIDALLVGTGGAILSPSVAASKGSSQVRPSCVLNDYLDSIENTNTDSVFDSYTQHRNLNYNDRVYIVAP